MWLHSPVDWTNVTFLADDHIGLTTIAESGPFFVVEPNPDSVRTLVITDSILASEAVRVAEKVRELSVAPLIGEAIRRIADESSVSSLFD